MSLESETARVADALEGILSHLTGTPVVKKGPGRPRKLEVVESPPADETAAVPEVKAEDKPVVEKAAPAPAADKPAEAKPVDPKSFTEQQVRERIILLVKNGQRDLAAAKLAQQDAVDAKTLREDMRAWFMANTAAAAATIEAKAKA